MTTTMCRGESGNLVAYASSFCTFIYGREDLCSLLIVLMVRSENVICNTLTLYPYPNISSRRMLRQTIRIMTINGINGIVPRLRKLNVRLTVNPSTRRKGLKHKITVPMITIAYMDRIRGQSNLLQFTHVSINTSTYARNCLTATIVIRLRFSNA